MRDLERKVAPEIYEKTKGEFVLRKDFEFCKISAGHKGERVITPKRSYPKPKERIYSKSWWQAKLWFNFATEKYVLFRATKPGLAYAVCHFTLYL